MSETTAPESAPEAAHTHAPGVIAKAYARNNGGRWETALKAGHHALVADESRHLDGQDKGPAPFELLLASLGACTSITLRMYAERKAWPLEAVDVDLVYREQGGAAVIDRTLAFAGSLDVDQRARLCEIAERTPVTKVLKTGAEIRTTLVEEMKR